MADSTILVKGEGWKVKVAIGLGGLAVIVILAFLYRIEVGLIVLAIGSAVGARVWVWAIHQHKLAHFERRRLEAEVRRLEYLADEARIKRHFLETNSGVFHIEHPTETIGVRQFYPAVSASRALAELSPLLPEPEPPVKRLLDIVWPHLLIVGPTGSGKTTVANHLIDNAEYDAIIYALDPHATQNKNRGLPWSPRAQVIGDGREWAIVDAMLVNLLVEMDDRFKSGRAALQPVYIANDEWLAVKKNCQHANEFFETIGSEAAKVNIHLMIATQAATVDDLGCSAAVRDNLVELRLDHALKAQNRGELRWGKRRDSIEVVELPGRYRAAFVLRPEPGSPEQGRRVEGSVVRMPEAVTPEPIEPPIPELDPGPIAPAPTADELRICELWDAGASLRAIWKEVYGTEFGGNQADRIKEVLRKWGRVI